MKGEREVVVEAVIGGEKVRERVARGRERERDCGFWVCWSEVGSWGGREEEGFGWSESMARRSKEKVSEFFLCCFPLVWFGMVGKLNW